MTPREIQNEVAPLSGTAAKILLVFAMSIIGRSFQAKEVALLAGVSINSATTAVKLLEMRGVLQNNGRSAGWSLKPGWLGVTGAIQPELLPVDNSAESVENAVEKNEGDHKICDRSTLRDHKNCDQGQENFTRDHKFCDQNPPIDRWIDSNNSIDQESIYLSIESNHKNCDFDKSDIRYWLMLAGVEIDSPDWAAVLDLGLEVDYVKAHVLEVESNDKLSTGALLYRLKQGWRAPKMRCETCLGAEASCKCAQSAEIKRLIAEGVISR